MLTIVRLHLPNCSILPNLIITSGRSRRRETHSGQNAPPTHHPRQHRLQPRLPPHRHRKKPRSTSLTIPPTKTLHLPHLPRPRAFRRTNLRRPSCPAAAGFRLEYREYNCSVADGELGNWIRRCCYQSSDPGRGACWRVAQSAGRPPVGCAQHLARSLTVFQLRPTWVQRCWR